MHRQHPDRAGAGDLVRASIVPGDGDPRHGTLNGYGNLGCHCPGCTEAHRVNHFRYMHADPSRLARHRARERERNARRRQAS